MAFPREIRMMEHPRLVPRSEDHVVFVTADGKPKNALVIAYDMSKDAMVLAHVHSGDIQIERNVPRRWPQPRHCWCWPADYCPEE